MTDKTTLPDAIDRIAAGTFYDDYDFAAGPGLRVLRAAINVVEDEAKRPCETKGLEDLEPGCCGPCRARLILTKGIA